MKSERGVFSMDDLRRENVAATKKRFDRFFVDGIE